MIVAMYEPHHGSNCNSNICSICMHVVTQLMHYCTRLWNQCCAISRLTSVNSKTLSASPKRTVLQQQPLTQSSHLGRCLMLRADPKDGLAMLPINPNMAPEVVQARNRDIAAHD